MNYSDDFLDHCRLIGDPVADEVVAKIFSDPEKGQILTSIRKLVSNNQSLDHLPEYLRKYFEENAILPEWADTKKMISASQLFENRAELILAMLGLLSLPYDYAGANGAKVLYLTERLRNDASKRLTETALFLLDVMDPKAFTEEGNGFISTLKVRLIHAVVRFQLKNSTKWNMEWGLPINQEDKAGTNLSFSLIPIRGMRKVWVNVEHKSYEDYLHLWNVISSILGLREELLPTDGKQAYWLEKSIRKRQFRPSLEGKELTESLLNSILDQSNGQLNRKVVVQYMRFLLGDEMAGFLELDSSVPNADVSTLIKTLQNLTFNRNQKAPHMIRKEILKEGILLSLPNY